MAEALADCVLEAMCRGRLSDLAEQLMLTPPLVRMDSLDGLTFSGGVSEFLYTTDRAESSSFGDLGIPLAQALRARLDDGRFPIPVVEAGERIRATVIGASQFTVQVSGSTIGIRAVLPLRDVPVVPLSGDFRGSGPIALAVKWEGEPEHARIRALAERVAAATDRRPLVVASDGDIAATLGAVLREELGFKGDLVTLDGLDLGDLDYIDVGTPVAPSGVVPVIVKSLVFQEEH
jgi:ethanolamine utilization protein EutA